MNILYHNIIILSSSSYFLVYFKLFLYHLRNKLKFHIYTIGITYSILIGTLFVKIWIVTSGTNNISTTVKRKSYQYLVIIVFLLIFFDFLILIPWTVLSPLKPSDAHFKIPVIGEICIMIEYVFNIKYFNRFSDIFNGILYYVFLYYVFFFTIFCIKCLSIFDAMSCYILLHNLTYDAIG